MGPNQQNQHFAELRQKVRLYIVVLLRCLPNLKVLSQKMEKWLPNSSQTNYNMFILDGVHNGDIYTSIFK